MFIRLLDEHFARHFESSGARRDVILADGLYHRFLGDTFPPLRITELHCTWVCHLKCSLCFLALPKESLDYTAPMGVPPKVQPLFVSST